MVLEISYQLTRLILIPLMVLGTIGNIFNLLIFTRPTLLRSPCTLYLLAASIDNILVIFTSLLNRLLLAGYTIQISTISNFMCKLRYYPLYVLLALSPYFFILACFDRYCSSSTSATRRSWSNKKTAKRLIVGAIIFASVLYVHMGIFFEWQMSSTKVSCTTRPGAYNLFYRIFYLVVFCILPYICMSVLCILTLKNIRQQNRRIQPGGTNGNDSLRRIDRQMIRMLFLQVLSELICVLPYAILNLLALYIDATTNVYSFFNQLLMLPLYVSYTTSFYVSTLSSRVYRQELMKILWFWKPRQAEGKRTIRTIGTTTATRKH